MGQEDKRETGKGKRLGKIPAKKLNGTRDNN